MFISGLLVGVSYQLIYFLGNGVQVNNSLAIVAIVSAAALVATFSLLFGIMSPEPIASLILGGVVTVGIMIAITGATIDAVGLTSSILLIILLSILYSQIVKRLK